MHEFQTVIEFVGSATFRSENATRVVVALPDALLRVAGVHTVPLPWASCRTAPLLKR